MQPRTLHVVHAHLVSRVGWGEVVFDGGLVEVLADSGFEGAEVVEDEQACGGGEVSWFVCPAVVEPCCAEALDSCVGAFGADGVAAGADDVGRRGREVAGRDPAQVSTPDACAECWGVQVSSLDTCAASSWFEVSRLDT